MHRAVFGLKELADLYGVTKQTMYQRLDKRYFRRFPEPAYIIAAGKIWTFEQIEEYLKGDRWGSESQTVKEKLKEIKF